MLSRTKNYEIEKRERVSRFVTAHQHN